MYLVGCSCYRVCIYSVVNICYVLGLWRLRVLDRWIWLCLRRLRRDLKLLLMLLWLELRRLSKLLLLWVLMLVLVLGKLLAHDLSWLGCCLWLRSHEVVLLRLRNSILCRVRNVYTTVHGLSLIYGINCVYNTISSSISALYGTNVRRRITLRNAIYLFLLLLCSTLSLTIKRIHHDTGLYLFICHLWVNYTRGLLWMKNLVEALRSMSSVFCLWRLFGVLGFCRNLLLWELNRRVSVHARI